MEAGEKLGFLPGDMQEKVDPYLRPLYDALFETFGAETFQRLFEKNIIIINESLIYTINMLIKRNKK